MITESDGPKVLLVSSYKLEEVDSRLSRPSTKPSSQREVQAV